MPILAQESLPLVPFREAPIGVEEEVTLPAQEDGAAVVQKDNAAARNAAVSPTEAMAE